MCAPRSQNREWADTRSAPTTIWDLTAKGEYQTNPGSYSFHSPRRSGRWPRPSRPATRIPIAAMGRSYSELISYHHPVGAHLVCAQAPEPRMGGYKIRPYRTLEPQPLNGNTRRTRDSILSTLPVGAAAGRDLAAPLPELQSRPAAAPAVSLSLSSPRRGAPCVRPGSRTENGRIQDPPLQNPGTSTAKGEYQTNPGFYSFHSPRRSGRWPRPNRPATRTPVAAISRSCSEFISYHHPVGAHLVCAQAPEPGMGGHRIRPYNNQGPNR